jgi:single-stranded-DNA-specific exonuclease
MKNKEIKNLKKAANRILKAIKNKEKIILYGDSDMDGVSSVIIAQDSIKSLGGNIVAVHFPDRDTEGYGLNEQAVRELAKFAPALLVVYDCGIGNFIEIPQAEKIGLETIVVDHHEILDKLPKASIIVDPKQKGDNYPFKTFAAAGLSFKLAEALFKGKMPEILRKGLLELAAMATIADMMPKEQDNEMLIAEGVECLKSSWRPAIQVLFGFKNFRAMNTMQRVYKINSLLNTVDMENHLPISYRTLVAQTKEEVEVLAEKLLEKDAWRRDRIKEIKQAVESRVAQKKDAPIVFEGDASWETPLMGTVAAMLIEGYQKPIFLYKTRGEEARAGIRAPDGFNVVDAMKSCRDLFITFGGHPRAAGFSAKTENLDKIRESLEKYFTPTP